MKASTSHFVEHLRSSAQGKRYQEFSKRGDETGRENIQLVPSEVPRLQEIELKPDESGVREHFGDDEASGISGQRQLATFV